MMKSLLAIVFSAVFGISSWAQQPDPQTIYIVLQPYKCDANHGSKNGDQIIFLENYVDGILPSPLWIDGSTFWLETNAAPVDAAHTILAFAGIDERMTYTNLSGFPYTQQYPAPAYLKTLGKASYTPNARWDQDFFPRSPLSYRSGDAIVTSIECGNNTNVNPQGGIYLWVHVSNLPGSILDLPQPTWLVNQKIAGYASAQPRVSLRNVIPASSSAINKVRVRFFNNWKNPTTTISNASICVQSAPGSSTCAGAPVELKFGKQSGFKIASGVRAWSDWTTFSAPAGANLLVTVSQFEAPAGQNAWSYGGAGIAVWTAHGDSWNTLSLQGTVDGPWAVYSAIDGVQIQ